MSYALEVEMIRLAHGKGLLTTPYVFNEADAINMTRAGADILVAHMGLTTGGAIGAETAPTLDECIAAIDRIAAAALSVRPDVIVLCHGGPIAAPEDAAVVLQNCRNCHGFYGASSMERLPTERAITATIREFKELAFGGRYGQVAGRAARTGSLRGSGLLYPPGSSMEAAIRSVEHVVLVLTPAALQSPYVAREWKLARQEGRRSRRCPARARSTSLICRAGWNARTATTSRLLTLGSRGVQNCSRRAAV